MEEGGEENGMSVYAIIWQTNKKFNPFLFRLLLEKAQWSERSKWDEKRILFFGTKRRNLVSTFIAS